MYEEEDDDLPIQYRRLTAHLQTQSPDFNRRLAAYLTNHVAMRSALEDSITSSYAQQYPNAPQFAHNHSVFQSPLMQQSPMQSPTSNQHRSAPYPTSGSPNYRGGPFTHGRSASIATPQELHQQTDPARDVQPQNQANFNRRMSMPPAQPTSTGHGNTSQDQGQQNMLQSDFTPFSTALPMESQMFLGSALDPNDPMTSMLMAGSENMPQYNPLSANDALSPNKSRHLHPSFDGLSSTLAPSALDKYPHDSVAQDDGSLSFDVFHASTISNDHKFGMAGQRSSNYRSGTVSPSLENDWSAFIDEEAPPWEQNTT